MTTVVERLDAHVEREHRRLSAWRWMEDLGFTAAQPTNTKLVYIDYDDTAGKRKQIMLVWTKSHWHKVFDNRLLMRSWHQVLEELETNQGIPFKVTLWARDGKVDHVHPDYKNRG